MRFAVVGLGRIGWRHAQAIGRTRGLVLDAVCEADASLRARAAETFGVGAYARLETMLRRSDAEAVVIATPSHLHTGMTIKALDDGRNVLCEKPVARSAAAATAMAAAARRNRRWLSVNQSLRYQADVVTVRRAIRGGKLGDVYQIYNGTHSFGSRSDWQIWRRYNGGAVANLGAHLVDSLVQLADARPTQVFAKLDRIIESGDAEDCFKIIISFAGGLTAEAETIKAAHGKPWWLVCGSRGTLRIPYTPPVVDVELTTRTGRTWRSRIDFRRETEPLDLHYRDLARCLQRDLPPPVSIRSVLTPMRVTDAARRSARLGRSVRVG